MAKRISFLLIGLISTFVFSLMLMQTEPREAVYAQPPETDTPLEEAPRAGSLNKDVDPAQPELESLGVDSTHSPVRDLLAQTVITRSYTVNPGGFLYDMNSTDIVMSIYYGLRWAPNTTERAGFYMGRPPDWDGQTPVVAHITFALGSSDAGTVNWRLRLNSYTPGSGEWLTNPASRDADSILVFATGPSSLRIYSQTFTLPAAVFNDEPYWSFFFTRGDGTNGETFTGNLYVMGVDVNYQVGP